MKRFVRFVAAALVVAGCAASSVAGAQDAAPAKTAHADCCGSCVTFPGKTLCVFGDSYVKNHQKPMSETWHAKAAEKLGMKYVNMGINGNSVLYDRTNRGFGKAMTVRCEELPDTMDCLLIIAGHNDAGLIEDPAELGRFRQELDSMLKNIKAKHPQTKIGYVTPWHVDRPNFNEVIDIVREVCAANSVPVFDAESAGGIKVNDPDFRAIYFQNGGKNDTAHLNDAGHDLVAPKGTEFIISLMK